MIFIYLISCVLNQVGIFIRLAQVEKYILGATRIVGGKAPRSRRRGQKLWLTLPLLVMLLPVSLVRRCACANGLMVAEIGFVLANCARQVAFGDFYHQIVYH